MTDIKRMEKPTDLICEKCGKPLVIKWGKHGSFIACTGYPECTNTRELTVDLPDVDKADLTEQGDEEYCENCGRPMVLKKGRFGTVLRLHRLSRIARPPSRSAATQKKADVPLDEKCPQCGNNLVHEVRPLRRVHRLQQLSDLQVRQAEDHRREVPELLARARSSSGAPSAARRSTAATAIPIATSSPGASRLPEKCPECGSPLPDREVAEGRAVSRSARTRSASSRSRFRRRLRLRLRSRSRPRWRLRRNRERTCRLRPRRSAHRHAACSAAAHGRSRIALVLYFMNRSEYPGPAARMCGVLALIGLVFLAVGAVMVWSSRVAKLRLRDQLLDSLTLRGDEKVLDVGCGRGLLAIGAAKRLKTGKVDRHRRLEPVRSFRQLGRRGQGKRQARRRRRQGPHRERRRAQAGLSGQPLRRRGFEPGAAQHSRSRRARAGRPRNVARAEARRKARDLRSFPHRRVRRSARSRRARRM